MIFFSISPSQWTRGRSVDNLLQRYHHDLDAGLIAPLSPNYKRDVMLAEKLDKKAVDDFEFSDGANTRFETLANTIQAASTGTTEEIFTTTRNALFEQLLSEEAELRRTLSDADKAADANWERKQQGRIAKAEQFRALSERVNACATTDELTSELLSFVEQNKCNTLTIPSTPGMCSCAMAKSCSSLKLVHRDSRD